MRNRRQLTQTLVDAIHRAKSDGSAWVNYGSFRFKIEPWNDSFQESYAQDNLRTLNENKPVLICAKKGHLWAVCHRSSSFRDKADCLLGSNIAIFPDGKNIRAFVSECYPRN